MKFPVKFAIGLIAFVIGISGIIVCVVPHYSAPEQVVSKYVSAVNSGNVDKMLACTVAGELSDSLDDLGLGDAQDWIDSVQGSTSDETIDKGLSALQKSFISVPSDAVAIKSVKLLGCSTGEKQSQMGITGYMMTALIQVTYTDAEDEKHTTITEEEVALINTGKAYKIADF